MIISVRARGSCSPCSLGRRRVGVRVGIIVIVVILLVLILVLLWVLLLGAPWRTIIRHPIVRGDVLLGGVVGRQFVLAGQQATWKLDGVV